FSSSIVLHIGKSPALDAAESNQMSPRIPTGVSDGHQRTKGASAAKARHTASYRRSNNTLVRWPEAEEPSEATITACDQIVNSTFVVLRAIYDCAYATNRRLTQLAGVNARQAGSGQV